MIMGSMKWVSILVLLTSCLIEIGLLCGLFTNEWIKEKEYHLGIMRYCFDTIADTSCHKVTDILSDLKGGLQSAVVIIFITQIVGSLSTSACGFGWSLYVVIAVLGLSLIILITQMISGCCCQDGCCATVGVASGALQFRQPPDDTSVKVGENVLITVLVDNANKVSWFKGAVRIISYSTSHSEEFDKNKGVATLAITNARFQDDGEYTCTAEKYGISKTEQRKFRLHVLPVKPEFKQELVDTSVNIDDQLQLEAKVLQAESITWQHDGIDISHLKGKRKILFRHGKATLKICNATLNDAGEYICKAISKGATQNEVETTSICHVTVHDALCPSFEDVPGDQKIRVGSTFEIEVKVKGYPRPEYVTWYKGEDIILKSRRINMQYLNGVAKLKVYDSCADDSGLYECVTENEHGNTTCRISVKIESRQENVAVCPVCMDKQPNKHLPCGHAICVECMERVGGVCPIDRAPFNIREASNLYLN
ncbi:peroxidasin homolog isoform X2 [Mytilus galloprovincialis]|uniref:peroxidasin homolog isoform X2 n=1 Tax=Mytilus galloprovincialis TaxID=29158 RepID=UPI003F7B561E